MEQLFSALKKAPDIAAWKVNSTHTESCELFYVQKKVETNRATSTEDCSVTIYVDEDGKRGQSSFTVYPYMDEEQILALIAENVFSAKFTFNAYFDLPHPGKAQGSEVECNLAHRPFSEIIGEIGEAIMKANNVENASLSATEIFLYKETKRIVNSNGVDAATTTYRCEIETIPNYVKGKEEFELYKAISFATFDPKDLTAKVAEVISLVRDRANAVQMQPTDSIPVILENEEVAEFFDALSWDLEYRTAYMRSNLFSVGDNLQKERTGDSLNLKLVPYVEGALSSNYIDSDGVTLEEVTLIEDGIVKSRHGSFQYGYYLGESKPTGRVPVMVVPEGKMSLEDFKKKGPYLRCVRFSGIQADLYSEFLGGEVRLGYYFDGEKEIPVTGFSIQANFNEAKSSFLASKESVTLDSYHGPKYLYIPNVKAL